VELIDRDFLVAAIVRANLPELLIQVPRESPAVEC